MFLRESYVAQAGLELTTLLPIPLECWDYNHVSLWPAPILHPWDDYNLTLVFFKGGVRRGAKTFDSKTKKTRK